MIPLLQQVKDLEFPNLIYGCIDHPHWILSKYGLEGEPVMTFDEEVYVYWSEREKDFIYRMWNIDK